MLAIGLITEAIIFALSAFDPDLSKEDLDWSVVYPELKGGKAKAGQEGSQQGSQTAGED